MFNKRQLLPLSCIATSQDLILTYSRGWCTFSFNDFYRFLWSSQALQHVRIPFLIFSSCHQADEKLRYPFFEELIWYTLARYVEVLCGRRHLVETLHHYGSSNAARRHVSQEDCTLSVAEVSGIQAMVFYLSQAHYTCKITPRFVTRPCELIRDVKELVDKQQRECLSMETGSVGGPVLVWVGETFG